MCSGENRKGSTYFVFGTGGVDLLSTYHVTDDQFRILFFDGIVELYFIKVTIDVLLKMCTLMAEIINFS